MTEKAQWEIDAYDETTPFVYIFIRKDIPKIHQLIQAAHVAHNAGISFGIQEGINNHGEDAIAQASFCVLGVKNEQELMAVAWELEHERYKVEMFHEPDFDMGYTAIATAPLIGEDSRKHFKKYSLLR